MVLLYFETCCSMLQCGRSLVVRYYYTMQRTCPPLAVTLPTLPSIRTSAVAVATVVTPMLQLLLAAQCFPHRWSREFLTSLKLYLATLSQREWKQMLELPTAFRFHLLTVCCFPFFFFLLFIKDPLLAISPFISLASSQWANIFTILQFTFAFFSLITRTIFPFPSSLLQFACN